MTRAPRTIVRHRENQVIKKRADAAFASGHRAAAHRASVCAAAFERAENLEGSPAERFLIGRGVAPPFSPSLKFAIWKQRSTEPAVIGALTQMHRPHNVLGLARLWLRNGFVDVFEPQHGYTPSTYGCGVMLGELGDAVVVGEQIESTHIAARLESLPGVAALDAARLAQLEIPLRVRRIVIAHERFPSSASASAALKLAARASAFGIRVTLLAPPVGFDHWRAFGRAQLGELVR